MVVTIEALGWNLRTEVLEERPPVNDETGKVANACAQTFAGGENAQSAATHDARQFSE